MSNHPFSRFFGVFFGQYHYHRYYFCLSQEPLAQAIRKSTASPMEIGDHNHITSLYADDIILF